jgi:hypothetical protein
VGVSERADTGGVTLVTGGRRLGFQTGGMYEYDYAWRRGEQLQQEAAAERLARAAQPEEKVRRWLPLELAAAIVTVGLGVSIRLFGLGLS